MAEFYRVFTSCLEKVKGWCFNRDRVLDLHGDCQTRLLCTGCRNLAGAEAIALLGAADQLHPASRLSSCRHSFRSQTSAFKNGTSVLFKIKE